MKDLNYFKEKIKDKRKKTDFRIFLKEISSHFSLTYYKNSGVISKFPETTRVGKVINSKDFIENSDYLLKGGLEYDNKINFFDNYQKLFLGIDIFNVIDHGGAENSGFADMVLNSKNAYLSTVVINNCENVLYSLSVKDNSVDVLNSIAIWSNCSVVYNSSGVLDSFKVFYSRFINNSNNIWFCSNLIGCSECILSDNLENKKYYIKNKEYSREEYLKKKEEVLNLRKNFDNFYLSVSKKGNNLASKNTTGSSQFNSEDVENGYFGFNVKNGKNIFFTGGIDGDENMYDCFSTGSPTAHDFYGVMGANGENLYCSKNIVNSSNLFYSYGCDDCSFCIGCVGLKNKSYCILNKQYSKEEWEKLSSQIFESMEFDGTLGEFFPAKLNPFYFNDTVAGLIGGFKKEEIIKEGYLWRDEEIKIDVPGGVGVIKTLDLEKYEGFDKDGNWKINPEILEKVIVDEKGNYYRIVKMEYDFLMKHGLPLPRLHWLDRMKVNFGV